MSISEVQLSEGVRLRATAAATIIPYPQMLLEKARELITNGDFGLAVVVAHTACEISVERAISRAFIEKDIGYLEKWVEEIIASAIIWQMIEFARLYNALRGDLNSKPNILGDPSKRSAAPT